MQPILIANDESKKLSHLSQQLPHTLLPIANRPVIVYAVEMLVEQGYKEMFVCLDRDVERVQTSLGNGNRWNVKFHYVTGTHGFGNGATLKRIGDRIKDQLLIIPGDSLIDVDLDALKSFHDSHGGLLTIVLHDGAATGETSENVVAINDVCKVISANDASALSLLSTGIYLVEPELLEYIPDNRPYVIGQELVPYLLSEGVDVYGYRMKGYCNLLNTCNGYLSAQETVLNSLLQEEHQINQHFIRYPYIDTRQIAPGVWCYPETTIHHSVRFSPPVYLGKGCLVGRDTEIGPNVVIGPHTVIEEGATIRDSVVLDETYIGRLLNVERRIVSKNLLIDINSGEHMNIDDPLILAEANPSMFPTGIWRYLGRLIS